jgi:hypothetical protein
VSRRPPRGRSRATPRGAPSTKKPAGRTARAKQSRPGAARGTRHSRRRTLPAVAAVAVAVIALVVAVVVAVRSSPSPSTEAPVLAPVSTAVAGQPVDGITCDAGEQLVFHVHAHLAVYVDGTPRTVPQGIGITSTCLYWLHTHTPDGIIHIEAPVQRSFMLGNFFDIWGTTLDGTHVGPAGGTVIAYVNGTRYTGDVRAIPLNAHDMVQLDVNGDVPPAPFTFPQGL